MNFYNPYDSLPAGLEIFDKQSLTETEALAGGLSTEEVLDFFGVTPLVLKQYPADEEIFNKAYRRGKSKAKYEACTHLFTSMKGRQGAIAALAYLRQHAVEWPQAQLDNGTNKNFSFKVVLDAEEEPASIAEVVAEG